MTFSDFTLISPLLKALQDEKYETPTPIQAQAIPVALTGRDILGCAQTGTGKTAAFALPILQLLDKDHPHPKKIRSLILTPTRELAIQIDESFKAYGKYLRLRNTVIFGGVSQLNQTNALKNGVDILVATPGRLLDLINQRYISLKNVEIFVLDEADRMLDMGFIHDVKKIIGMLPQKRQTFFFSATMPPEIVKLSDSLLHQPEKIVVTPVSSTAEKVQQQVYFATKNDKNALLLHLVHELKIKSALVFTRTKHGADKVSKFLIKKGVKADAIHGNKSQNARQRALNDFKEGKITILVATDIAARGIDIDKLEYVFNFDLSNIPETYVHRIGRTGRAGESGLAISFCDEEELPYLRDTEKLIGKKIPVAENNPYHIPFIETKMATSAPNQSKKLIPASSQKSGTAKKKKWFGKRNFVKKK